MSPEMPERMQSHTAVHWKVNLKEGGTLTTVIQWCFLVVQYNVIQSCCLVEPGDDSHSRRIWLKSVGGYISVGRLWRNLLKEFDIKRNTPVPALKIQANTLKKPNRLIML